MNRKNIDEILGKQFVSQTELVELMRYLVDVVEELDNEIIKLKKENKEND